MESPKKTTMEALRRTGRTTRMLERAVELAKKGKRVCVVVKSHDKNSIKSQLQDMWAACMPYGHGSISVTTADESFDWNTMRVVGSSFEVVHLIDHWVLESRYRQVIDRLHEFDPPAVVMVPDQPPKPESVAREVNVGYSSQSSWHVDWGKHGPKPKEATPSGSNHHIDVAIRRIAEFDFDDNWHASDMRQLADDSMTVVGELCKMQERASPKEKKCVCGQPSKMFSSDMDYCPACRRQWYV